MVIHHSGMIIMHAKMRSHMVAFVGRLKKTVKKSEINSAASYTGLQQQS